MENHIERWYSMKEITEYLKSTDRMQKTIVFCANEDHADRMRTALTNLNADMCKENPERRKSYHWYVVYYWRYRS